VDGRREQGVEGRKGREKEDGSKEKGTKGRRKEGRKGGRGG
jgi:hypothetical protein